MASKNRHFNDDSNQIKVEAGKGFTWGNARPVMDTPGPFGDTWFCHAEDYLHLLPPSNSESVAVTYSGAYNTPLGSVGQMYVRVEDDSAQLLKFSDGSQASANGQLLHVYEPDGTSTTYLDSDQVNVVDRTDILNLSATAVAKGIKIGMCGWYNASPGDRAYSPRYIKSIIWNTRMTPLPLNTGVHVFKRVVDDSRTYDAVWRQDEDACSKVPRSAIYIMVAVGTKRDFYRPAKGTCFCDMFSLSRTNYEWSFDGTNWVSSRTQASPTFEAAKHHLSYSYELISSLGRSYTFAYGLGLQPPPPNTFLSVNSFVELDEQTTAGTLMYWQSKCTAVPADAAYAMMDMGAVRDYFKPIKGASWCDMFTNVGGTAREQTLWSRDGINWVQPAAYHTHYGGSAEGWPALFATASVAYFEASTLEKALQGQEIKCGWQLVRRVGPGLAWHPATDDVKGTALYGNITSIKGSGLDPETANVTFSVPWKVNDYQYILFATGDFERWLVTTPEAVHGFDGKAISRDVLMSSANRNPHTIPWYNRNGTLEDPLITVKEDRSLYNPKYQPYVEDNMLYIENSRIRPDERGRHDLAQHNGANVYVGNMEDCPIPTPAPLHQSSVKGDMRNTLSFWGNGREATPGGCCSTSPHEARSDGGQWRLSFTIQIGLPRPNHGCGCGGCCSTGKISAVGCSCSHTCKTLTGLHGYCSAGDDTPTTSILNNEKPYGCRPGYYMKDKVCWPCEDGFEQLQAQFTGSSCTKVTDPWIQFATTCDIDRDGCWSFGCKESTTILYSNFSSVEACRNKCDTTQGCVAIVTDPDDNLECTLFSKCTPERDNSIRSGDHQRLHMKVRDLPENGKPNLQSLPAGVRITPVIFIPKSASNPASTTPSFWNGVCSESLPKISYKYLKTWSGLSGADFIVLQIDANTAFFRPAAGVTTCEMLASQGASTHSWSPDGVDWMPCLKDGDCNVSLSDHLSGNAGVGFTVYYGVLAAFDQPLVCSISTSSSSSSSSTTTTTITTIVSSTALSVTSTITTSSTKPTETGSPDKAVGKSPNAGGSVDPGGSGDLDGGEGDTTFDGNPPDNTGNSTGGIIAGVLVPLLLIVSIAVAILCKRRKGEQQGRHRAHPNAAARGRVHGDGARQANLAFNQAYENVAGGDNNVNGEHYAQVDEDDDHYGGDAAHYDEAGSGITQGGDAVYVEPNLGQPAIYDGDAPYAGLDAGRNTYASSA